MTTTSHGPRRDETDLAAFGYRQTLDRTLGGFSAFAAGFSYLSILTGSSQLFHLGYDAGGPAFFWTWPAVFLGQMLVALCFAEMAALYPLSGGVYQWSKRLGGGSSGWLAGWVYLACAVITLSATSVALQTTLPQLSDVFQVIGRADDRADAARNAALLACGLVGLTTLVNTVGVRLLSRLNNVGVFVEMAAAIGLIGLLAWHARRGPEVVLHTMDRGDGSTIGYLAPALAAALMATFVLYGFDTAGSLAEETDDPRRRAPRAILLALASVGTAGSLLVLCALRAAPDLADPALRQGSGGLPYVIKAALGPGLGTPLLVGTVCSIVVCTMTVHAAGVRLVFAMARDNHLPGASALAHVGVSTRTPVLPALLVGAAAAGLLLVNSGEPHLIEAMASVAVVWANLAYLFVTVPMLRRRLDRDPRLTPEPGRFSLGRWGLPVNLAAVAWGVLMVVNTGWPRPSAYGEGWLGRTGALVPTAVMLAAGLGYEFLFGRRRKATVLDEHRPEPTAAAAADADDRPDGGGADGPPPPDPGPTPPPAPAPPRRRLRDRLRSRRLTRPRR